jgi:hypothetical protein
MSHHPILAGALISGLDIVDFNTGNTTAAWIRFLGKLGARVRVTHLIRDTACILSMRINCNTAETMAEARRFSIGEERAALTT